jgi:TUG ubiquitin-like domain
MSTGLPVRVMVADVWDTVPLNLEPSTSLADLKLEALTRTRVQRDPDEYVVKFRGAEMLDESVSLKNAGIPPNAALIVLPRRRRPVR